MRKLFIFLTLISLSGAVVFVGGNAVSFRGESKSLSGQIARMDERLRLLETLTGGGVQSIAQASFVADEETSTSNIYGDLGGVERPTVQVRVGPSGRLLLFVVSKMRANGFSTYGFVSFEIRRVSDGVVVVAAGDSQAYSAFVHTESSDGPQRSMASALVENLAPDLYIVAHKYSVAFTDPGPMPVHDPVRFADRLLIAFPF